jgi:hypothetical protein
VLSSLIPDAELASGELRRVRIDGLDLHRDLHAVWVRRPPPPALAHDLIAAIT